METDIAFLWRINVDDTIWQLLQGLYANPAKRVFSFLKI